MYTTLYKILTTNSGLHGVELQIYTNIIHVCVNFTLIFIFTVHNYNYTVITNLMM